MIYKLKDICIRITDGSHFSPKAKTNGYPMFSVKDMLTYGFDYSNCKRICKEDFEKMLKSGCVPQAGDVLVAKDGSYLKEIFVCTETKKEAVLSSIAIFRPNQKIVNSYFLCYLLKSPNIYNYISSNCVSGSALPRIILKAFKEIEVDIPDLHVQENIVRILKLLDDKIALNTRINRNLSEQLKVIFSKMFPTIADNGSNTLEEIISFSNGKKRPDTEGKVPVYGGNGILFYTDKSNAENCVIIGRVGAYCGSLYLSIEPCWISDNAIKAEAKNSKSQMFIYYLLQELALSNRHIGTSQPLLTQGILNAIPFTCPSEEGIISFCKKADDIQKLIDMNTIENKRLSELRDTLLPKLMSGELDVSDFKV